MLVRNYKSDSILHPFKFKNFSLNTIDLLKVAGKKFPTQVFNLNQ